jgi:SAM-dependent methyltransferase
MNGWTESSQAWIDFVDRGDPNRIHIIDPAVREFCGECTGLTVLDVGCGEGRFCRSVADAGLVVGLEPIPQLAQTARERQTTGAFVCASGEKIPLQNGCVDLVVSVLSLIDIPDFRAAICEMSRVLRPGGRLVIANLTSMATANNGGWTRNALGQKVSFPIDRYFEERGENAEWAGIKVVNFHRPLDAYMTAFLDSGLILRQFKELRPVRGAEPIPPVIEDNDRVPLFLAMEWAKP